MCRMLYQVASCQLRRQAGPQKLTVPELEEKLLAAGGPQTQGTKADYVKFHDDKVRRGCLSCQRPEFRTSPLLGACLRLGLAGRKRSVGASHPRRARLSHPAKACLHRLALAESAGGHAQSTYTGVYAKGGPTNVDASGNLSDLLDRSPADVRGIKK